MIIQFAKFEDLPSIVEIYNQSIRSGVVTGDMDEFRPEDREDWFNIFDRNSYPIYVIRNNETVVGYATLSPYRKGRRAMSKIAEVSYFLHFDYRGKGIGSMLMDHVIKDCVRLKKEVLLAILVAINDESVRFLKKWQFEEWARMPDIIDFGSYRCDHLIYGRKI